MSERKMFGENMSGGICPYGMSVSLLINPRQAPLGNNQFFGVVHGSVKFRTPHRGSDRVRSTG